MKELSQQRCFHHGFREAVARCPECSRFFCRECITEHKEQVLCTTCLNKTVAPQTSKPTWIAPLIQLGFFFFGIITLWLTFYYIGQFLLWLPDSFHEGSLWTKSW